MADLNDSILDVTKKLLGLDSDFIAFDLDIITHINSVFFTLTQLGIGPVDGFSITGQSETWGDFVGSDQIHAVRSYMGLRVRMLFDPPQTGPLMDALKKQADEFEWRLNIHMEGVRNPWVQPTLFGNL